MNRAARVTTEGKLPEWVQRWLSYRNQWEGTQWCTCAGGIPNYPTRMSKYLRRKNGFRFLFASFVFGLQARWEKSFLHSKDLAKAPSSLTKWCWDIVLRSLLSWQPPELLKEMRVRRQHLEVTSFLKPMWHFINSAKIRLDKSRVETRAVRLQNYCQVTDQNIVFVVLRLLPLRGRLSIRHDIKRGLMPLYW